MFVAFEGGEGSGKSTQSVRLAARLDPASFLRVHRSAIIHRQRLHSFRRGAFASLTAVLDDGTEVRVGRTYERMIREAIRETGKGAP